MAKVHFLLLLTAFSSFLGCKTDVMYPAEPILSDPQFRISEQEDSTAKQVIVTLSCTFTDGDGDIGLTQADTVPPNNVNFFIDYYEKIDGEFTKVTAANSLTDTVNYNSRIPIINSDGSKKSISGDISIDINATIRGSDTLKFSYYIIDRAAHKSNTLESIVIIPGTSPARP